MQKKDAAKAPSSPGVYIFYSQKKPIYIGKASNLKARILSHFQAAKLDPKERLLTQTADKISFLKTDSDFRSILLEAKLINKYQPRYNVRSRDDKSNLFLQINLKERFPKVLAVRQKDLSPEALFFGPFPSQKIVLEVINNLRKIIPFCTQKKITKSACFYSKIGLCSPCPNYISSLKDKDLQKKLTKIYRQNIKQIIKILQGKTKTVLLELYKKLNQEIKTQNYEQALKIRNQIQHFEYLIQKKTFHYEEPFILHQAPAALENLKKLLVKYYPQLTQLSRIEGVDISNLFEEGVTGSLVTFIDGLPSKVNYKRFKIKKRNGSDLDRIQEVLERRFAQNWPKPDLLLIDGGTPQVRLAKQVLNKIKVEVPLVGIAKGPDRLVIGKNLSSLRLPLNHLGFNLLKEVRDEAHRFAKKYHLLLRNQKFKL